ncbi:hypothetical protein HPB47_006214 [Ixodes persulcatus]|uniref:Uncharacterized protein n=1 Tax=Ixodes persulcatus TaxID=34615 RepID=A0AC60PBW8_IXOPE|nr:hypothetical protein HPB47_006214 [Ixodes persulcatus]
MQSQLLHSFFAAAACHGAELQQRRQRFTTALFALPLSRPTAGCGTTTAACSLVGAWQESRGAATAAAGTDVCLLASTAGPSRLLVLGRYGTEEAGRTKTRAEAR